MNKFDICIHIGSGGDWLADFYLKIRKELNKDGITVLFYTDVLSVKEKFDAINFEDYIFLPNYQDEINVEWAMNFIKEIGFNPFSLYNSEKKFYDLGESDVQKYFAKFVHAVFTLKDSKKADLYFTYEGDEIDHNIFRILGRIHKGKPVYWGISNLDIRTHFHYEEKRYSKTPQESITYIPDEELIWLKKYLSDYTKAKTNLWGDPKRDDVKFKLSYFNSSLNKLLKYVTNKELDPRRTLKHSAFRYFQRIYRRQYAYTRYIKNFQLDTSKNYYYFPLHVPFDSQLTQRGLPFYDQASLIQTISNYLPYGSKLLVKEHPMGRGYYKTSDLKKLSSIPNVVLLPVTTNSHDILPNAKAIFVINSSVGYEALMYGKTVVTFGRSFYRKQGLTIDINSLYDLETVFDKIENHSVKEEDVLKFLYRVKKNTYPVDLYNINKDNYLSKVDGLSNAIKNEFKISSIHLLKQNS